MNINEVSQKLHVNPETLRKWDKHFSLNIKRNRKGHREYSEDDIKKLHTIKQLRDLDHGLNTIQKKIEPSYIHDIANRKSTNKEVYVEESGPVSKLDLIKSEVVSKLDSKLDSIIAMSEKLSRASYEIGKLQAEKAGLEDKVKLISDTTQNDYLNLKEKLEKVTSESEFEVDSLKEQNRRLREELEREKIKPWFQRLKEIISNYYFL